jgi:hypothetical protein
VVVPVVLFLVHLPLQEELEVVDLHLQIVQDKQELLIQVVVAVEQTLLTMAHKMLEEPVDQEL